jgi:type I restriction enzyme S subunit
VRRKVEGGEVGLPPGLAALFPDSFEPSRAGLVPGGWDVGEIGSEVGVLGGSTPSTGNPAYWGGDIAFATPKDLSSLSSPVVLATERRITDAGAATISSGVLPPGTMLMSSRAPIGYLAIAEVPVCVNQGFIAMMCEGSLPNQYVLQWARHNMELIVGNANGTTFLEISKRNFRPLPVVVPPSDLCERFQEIAAGLHRRVVSNLRESARLGQLRDALLPTLLSGAIRARTVGPAQAATPKVQT